MSFLKPRLSVCVVAQNHGHLLRNLFRNVAPVAWEVVLIDGGSTDDTDEIVREFSMVRHYREPWPGSVIKQKNIALRRARGDWALILDCDELLSPQLRDALPRLMRNPFVRYYKFPRYNVVHIDPYEHVVAKSTYPNFHFRMLRIGTGLFYDEKKLIHSNFVDPKHPGRQFRGVRKKLFMRKLRDLHIFHYDFFLNDRAAREKKSRWYESMQLNAGLERCYLWEDVPHKLEKIPPPWPEEWQDPRPSRSALRK